MRNIFFGVLMVAIILEQSAFAQSLPMETSQSIGIIDFVIKKSKYEEVSCGAHSCQMKSVEGGVNLKLTHATMQQDRAENLHYLLQVSVKGTLFSTKVEVHYRNDPNLQTLKTGKRVDEIDSSYKTEHRVLRSWIQFIKDSTASKS